MTPPPIIVSFSGISFRSRISRFVRMKPDSSPSLTPGIGGVTGTEPVAIRSFAPVYVCSAAETVKPSAVLPVILASAITTVTLFFFSLDLIPLTSVLTTLFLRSTTKL